MSGIVQSFSERTLRIRDPEESEGRGARKLSKGKRGWTLFFQRTALVSSYQKRIVFNSDIEVAVLEFTIMILSLAQLQLSYRSPHWRENRACAALPNCIKNLSDGSFAVANVTRVAIAVLALVRLAVRIHQLWKTKLPRKKDLPWFKMTRFLQYVLELIYTVVFPYPGLEYFLPGDHSNNFVILSVSVLIRTTSWGQLLYYPYPIRQKEKVASFSGNLEFSYRQFVLKKVLDDTPHSKVAIFFTALGVIAVYLLLVLETILGNCSWEQNDAVLQSGDAVCYELHVADAIWMVFMTFLSIGYGDVSPRTSRGRAVIAITACIAIWLDAVFFSLIIKKFTFSTMEGRVHAFLYRMELHKKKDVSAVLAVQATFRYNKSYKYSSIWHQQQRSNILYRPLSARLPNEVKKKLYVSRFQSSLKEIMKYNTDGDPLNAFSKHVEVITSALGATFIDMIRLKKMYYRRIRMLEQRRQQANRRTSSFSIASNSHPLLAQNGVADARRIPLEKPKSDSNTVDQKSTAIAALTAVNQLNTLPGGVTTAWADEMQRKCDATMALLKKIETNAKSAPHKCSW